MAGGEIAPAGNPATKYRAGRRGGAPAIALTGPGDLPKPPWRFGAVEVVRDMTWARLRAWCERGGAGPQWLLLAVLCAAAGLWSVRVGTDANWDLRNYHLYGPYALLNGRIGQDIAPAQLQSFYNPVVNFYYYGLFRLLNGYPRGLAFMMGVPAGIYAFALWQVARLVARDVMGPGKAALLLAAAATLLGMTGVGVRPSIGSSMNDVNVAALIMLAVWIALRAAYAGGRPGVWSMALLGLLCGAAVGLKLTNVLYAAPLGLLVLWMFGLRAALAAGIAMGLAFLAGWAPFALIMWREFASPVFPLYNDIFASPDFLATRFIDARFLPRDALQAVFYPFYWTVRNENLVTELAMRDWRVAAGYLSAGAVLAVAGCRWLLEEPARIARPALLLFLFCAAAYALWTHMFGIYRYLLVVESLSAVLMMFALRDLLPGRRLWVGALYGVAAIAILASTRVPNWGHVRHGARAVQVELPEVAPDSMVLLMGDDALSYLVPFLPPGVRAIGLRNNMVRDGEEHGLARRIRAAIAAHQGPLLMLAENGRDRAAFAPSLAAHGLRAGACAPVRSNLEPGGYALCRLERVVPERAGINPG